MKRERFAHNQASAIIGSPLAESLPCVFKCVKIVVGGEFNKKAHPTRGPESGGGLVRISDRRRMAPGRYAANADRSGKA